MSTAWGEVVLSELSPDLIGGSSLSNGGERDAVQRDRKSDITTPLWTLIKDEVYTPPERRVGDGLRGSRHDSVKSTTSSEQGVRNDLLLNLVSPLVDADDTRIAVVPLNRIFC